ncbi:PrsW family intramembrane metalloprotease [Kribbella qitaiheensis]|uniref:PrsW family intramembrane metalloprotease n=1 Tax=Kribbella qitaiheensis TaxID=1544730 RepID=A0A7G6X7W2_9ACTN|nr:PrsW family glutamic-type intramembrane protease [Kribbella qitaiheensis]QNE22327.1 PrsW family intramembrane metalloprotease [Kribbella qitaiheensis]
MECPRCSSAVPEVSHFCHHCGNDLQTQDAGRKKAYAARPDEPVASFKLVSTIMPQGAGRQPYTYKVALGVALLLTVVLAALGALPVAIMVAAFAIPIVYILYLYDVNLWEDEPIPVVAAAFLLTGVLAAVFTWLWSDKLGLSSDTIGSNSAGPAGRDLLILMLLVPVVSELVRQIGPLYLASRPRYDDLMDGFTFGVVAGVGYACFETLVLHWSWISGGFAGPGSSAGTWISIVVLQGFVKPLIYGSATGLAAAEFSGLGEKYDGFTPRWVVGLAQAMVVNALFQGGVYLLGFVGGHGSTIGAILGVVWGVVLLGALIILVRTVLHKGLLEAALESAARGGSNHASGELAFCSRCEMPLLPHSDFCSACGNSVRSVPKAERGVAVQGSGPAAGFEGSTGETQA